MRNTAYESTDWTAYYSKPKSKFSSSTQKITLEKLAIYMTEYAGQEIDVLELGGGNSCFAQGLMKKVNIRSYSIADNCELAVNKFKQMNIPGNAYLVDLTSRNALDGIEQRFDVVYSVGLIEHFRGGTIEKIIETHFGLCKPGGLVIISVPTPTTQYRIIRKMMEILKVWGFPDEKPLKGIELCPIIKQKGKILISEINWKLPLTQLIFVVKNEK